MEILIRIIVYLGLILLSIMYLVIVFLDKKYIVVIAIIGFSLGMIFGMLIKGIPSGLLTGSFMGFLIDILLIPSGLLAKYYRTKGMSRLRRNINKK